MPVQEYLCPLEGRNARHEVHQLDRDRPGPGESAQLLADPAYLPKWLRGMVLHERVNGIHGQLGTKSRIVMQSGNRKVEFTETITRREPADLHGIPKGVVVHFDRESAGAGMWCLVRDRLTEVDPETTLWESEMRANSGSAGR